MARKTQKNDKPAITAHRHKDKRKNIPTEELRDFVVHDENAPKSVLYPRNPDLDPQLVWKGKDEQDAAPLEVPAVPVYIQEKVHPQAIIEDFRQTAAKAGGAEPQLDLFADFNGLPTDFDQRVDFYHHEGHWSNRLILGDSLLVMNSLAEKEGLKGRVQTIYLDPPYGIKFGSNWQVSTRKRDVKDGKAEDLVRQPEQIKAFRDTWKLGIHSYLAYLRDRLVVARDLLTESGSIFVQIGDENVHLVRSVMDEVLGSNSFCSLITFAKTSGQTDNLLASVSDYVLWYAKDREKVKYRQVYLQKDLLGAGGGYYSKVRLPDGSSRTLTDNESESTDSLPKGSRIYRLDNLISQSPGTRYEVSFQGRRFFPSGYWKTEVALMPNVLNAGRVEARASSLAYVRFLDDFPVYALNSTWTDTGIAGRLGDKMYVVQTTPRVIERCLLMTTDPGDLVLDPTCGSGTTAYVAEQWGRRWITIDSSRVALTLARTRLMCGRFPYYLLADSPEGIAKEADATGKMPPMPPPRTEGDIRRGFVYERVPHVTLKAIANNEEIDTIHAKWQEKLDPLCAKINKSAKTLGHKWEEWEIPRLPADDLPDLENAQAWKSLGFKPDSEPAKLIREWWDTRRQRQKEIDDSIARRAEYEILYDRPYEDKKRVRVTGPFTVESLSPHRTISVDEKRDLADLGKGKDGRTVKIVGPDQFGNLVLENLRTAGVQNTRKAERLKFDSLEPYAGQWIHGEGRYTEAESAGAKGGKAGGQKRVAVCIGPEHGTVGPELIKEAAKEAVQGVGFDLLIVCGFAFDPHVSEEVKRYGKLTVLPTRMNPDLAMGDLLKKTGAANLFMVFGEPDIGPLDPKTGKLLSQKDGSIVIEIKGLDVYDPTTGEIRSSATDDIACWFIDTNYNGESFFVRHAYFTGADEPYEKLKRALRAEVDEAAWSALYATKSRLFEKPETGKVAVKVINHYGDEVLKVYEVK